MENAKKSAVKKILVCAIALAMATGAVTGMMSVSVSAESGGSVDSGSWQDSAIDSNEFIVKIPEKIEDKTVTEIGEKAFKHDQPILPIFGEEDSSLNEESSQPSDTSDTLTYGDFKYEVKSDGTVKIIGYNAPEDADKLCIDIPDSVEYIGDEAFVSLSFTLEIEITHLPKNVKKIGNEAFKNAKIGLDAYQLDKLENLVEIGKGAFAMVFCGKNASGAYEQPELTFPNSLKKIGDGAFADAAFIKLNFNDGLEYIGEGAFSSGGWAKPGIAEVTIPKSVKYIGDGAFWSIIMDRYTQDNVTFKYYSGGFVEDYLKADDFSHNFKKIEAIGTIDEEPSQQEMNYGISVKGAYPEGAVLNAVATTTKWLEDPLFCFNITLQKDGEEVQPNGYITVSIPCSVEGGRVYYIDEETGEMEFLNAIYVDGEYKFVTDHLSEYCIKFADGTDISNALSKPEQKTDNNNSDNNTDDTSNINSSNTNTENTDNNNNTNSNNNTNTNNNANNTSNSNTTDNSKSNSVVVPATGDNSAFTFGALIMSVISAAAVFMTKRRKSL